MGNRDYMKRHYVILNEGRKGFQRYEAGLTTSSHATFFISSCIDKSGAACAPFYTEASDKIKPSRLVEPDPLFSDLFFNPVWNKISGAFPSLPDAPDMMAMLAFPADFRIENNSAELIAVIKDKNSTYRANTYPLLANAQNVFFISVSENNESDRDVLKTKLELVNLNYLALCYDLDPQLVSDVARSANESDLNNAFVNLKLELLGQNTLDDPYAAQAVDLYFSSRKSSTHILVI